MSRIIVAIAKASKMFKLKGHEKLPPISNDLLLMPAHKLSAQIKDGSVSKLDGLGANDESKSSGAHRIVCRSIATNAYDHPLFVRSHE